MITTTHASTLVIIPCAAAKADAAAPAAELYSSANFRHMLTSAQAYAASEENAKVMILSAVHGLVELDAVLAPYDTKMGQAGSIDTAELIDQLVSLAPAEIVSMLPSAYYLPIWSAVSEINENGSDEDPWISLLDTYEAAPGIGFQRGVASALVRIAA